MPFVEKNGSSARATGALQFREGKRARIVQIELGRWVISGHGPVSARSLGHEAYTVCPGTQTRLKRWPPGDYAPKDGEEL